MNISLLTTTLQNASAIRIKIRLRPVNGSTVYPPTYAPPKDSKHNAPHIIVMRKEFHEGELVDTVLLNSRQAEANQFEQTLKKIGCPNLLIKCQNGEVYSVFDLSHRVYDAVLSETELDGTRFWDTKIGQAIKAARLQSADALYTHAPQVLLLGGWDSHAGGVANAARIPRIITSEIIGIDATLNPHAATKSDPMDLRKESGPVYKDENQHLTRTKPKKAPVKELKLSNAGLGNALNYELERVAAIRYAEQITCISIPALRRICFSGNNSEKNEAGQLSLLALALQSIAERIKQGYDLRSGCHLIPEQKPSLEIIGSTWDDIKVVDIELKELTSLLSEARAKAKKLGLEWKNTQTELSASATLNSLIQVSRELATNTAGLE